MSTTALVPVNTRVQVKADLRKASLDAARAITETVGDTASRAIEAATRLAAMPVLQLAAGVALVEVLRTIRVRTGDDIYELVPKLPGEAGPHQYRWITRPLISDSTAKDIENAVVVGSFLNSLAQSTFGMIGNVSGLSEILKLFQK